MQNMYLFYTLSLSLHSLSLSLSRSLSLYIYICICRGSFHWTLHVKISLVKYIQFWTVSDTFVDEQLTRKQQKCSKCYSKHHSYGFEFSFS